MDLQKERELFLAHMRSIGSAGFMFELDEDGNFDDMSMAYAWSAWQAAKAQAVQQGFVLVPKEPTQAMLDAFPEVEYEDTYCGTCHIWVDDLTLTKGYKAMLEAAQEPTND